VLSFCASAVHTIDGGVYIENVEVGSDGSVPGKEEKTLGKVQNLKFVKSSRGTVTLSWDKVDGAYAYKVFIKYEGDEKYRYTYTVKNNEVTIGDIENEGGQEIVEEKADGEEKLVGKEKRVCCGKS
jgi:hypothetical protein